MAYILCQNLYLNTYTDKCNFGFGEMRRGLAMRVLIVDQHPLFREALGNLLEQLYPGAAVFEVGLVEEAVGVLAQYDHFDLIILDIFLPGEDSVANLTLLQDKARGTPIVIMSCVDDPDAVRDVLGRGVRGYITKSAGAGDVKNALHLILAGEIYISPSILIESQQHPAAHSPVETTHGGCRSDMARLTPRQQEVFHLIAQGLPNKAIARQLKCSDGTVKLHVSAILRALQVHNRTEAVKAAVQMGMA